MINGIKLNTNNISMNQRRLRLKELALGTNSLTTKDLEAIYLQYGLTFKDVTPKIFLSKKELDWLTTHDSKIKVCIDPNWMPFEKIQDHKYIGLASEYMKLIEQHLNIPINLKETTSWAQSLEYIKDKKCDILPFASKTDSREKFLNFHLLL